MTSTRHGSQRPLRRRVALALLLIVVLGLEALSTGRGAPSARAMETDQFLAWDAGLEDIAPQLNAFLNERIETVLEEINARSEPPLQCADLVTPIFRDMHLHPFASRLRSFLEKDEEVVRHPEDQGNFGYFRSSIYRRPAWPFYLPLASTVNVGGVLAGLDKFPHIFGSGRRYHARYREALEEGASPEEAMRRAILFGARQENWLLGRRADGVFSFADLEANYQGLLLAIDLCEGDPPHLELQEDGWQLMREVDLREYVNPGFDESYNNNRYSAYRWHQVEPILREQYCPVFLSEEVQARYEWYRRIERPSLSSIVVREFLEERGVGPQWEHSMEVVCHEQLPIRIHSRSAPQ
jgi:hypothetical protein